MAQRFTGKIALDVRDSVPDWAPYLAPRAPKGSPNVLIVAWDDVGYGAMDVFGGPIKTPTMQRIADRGDQMRVYVPFGTDWYAYFMRRLAERPANVWFVLRSVIGG